MPTRDGKGGRPLISKKEKTARLVLSAVLPLGFYLVCYFVSVSSLAWLVAATFAAALAYAVPCMVNVHRIKSSTHGTIKPFIFADAVYSLLPSAFVSFALGLLFYLFVKSFDGVFMLSILLIILFAVICLCFWQVYFICNAFAKRFGRR